MLNCKLTPNGSYNYILSVFRADKKVIKWNNKKCHFKEGDFFRVKGKNGYVKEVEITEILENGMVLTTEYSSFRWHNGSKIYKKGKMTYSVTLSSFYSEDMFFDLQCRGHKFHKIKALSLKHRKIKTHWDTRK